MTGEARNTVGGPGSDRNWPLHSFLLAAASVLALLAGSLDQASFTQAVPALATAVSLAAAVYLAVALVRRRLDARTAVIASIWTAGALFYAALFGWLNEAVGGGFAMLRALPAALVVLVLLSVAAARLPAMPVAVVHLVLNAIAIVLVATPLWQVAAHEWRYGGARSIYDAGRAAAAMPQIAAAGDVKAGPRLPDIYHFVFDRYASQQVLAEYYDMDDSATGRFLEERGFHVARASHSNYHRTAHSLASTFYMDYLDLFAGAPGLAGSDWRPVHAMLGDHRAARFLKARGYRFVQFGSWWTGTFDNPAADLNRPHGFGEFTMLYLRGTMLRPIFHALAPSPLNRRLDWDNGQCQRVAAQIGEIRAIARRDRSGPPVYVFAHILVPHGPYNFAADGRCLTMEESGRRGARRGYLDQVTYAGRLIREVVPALQSQERGGPAILIQSDEGPFPAFEAGVPWHEQPQRQLRIKTGILNAYYFPGGGYEELGESITPVNSYRVLFNALFDAGFSLLPDRVFVFPDDDRLYEFHDVTDRVR